MRERGAGLDVQRLGCQARPWIASGASVRDALERIGKTGYEGAEVGYRLLAGMSTDEVEELLETQRLVLAGVHLALPWQDVDPAELDRVVDELVGFVEPLGAWVIASGQRALAAREPKGWDVANRALRRTGERLSEAGLKLCYHNHGWEFGVPGLFEALTDGLPLAIDVAHMARAGVEVVPWFEDHAERIEYLHLRDVSGGAWAPALGRGSLPVAACLAIAEHARWLVVETEPDPLHPSSSSSGCHSSTSTCRRARDTSEPGVRMP